MKKQTPVNLVKQIFREIFRAISKAHKIEFVPRANADFMMFRNSQTCHGIQQTRRSGVNDESTSTRIQQLIRDLNERVSTERVRSEN